MNDTSDIPVAGQWGAPVVAGLAVVAVIAIATVAMLTVSDSEQVVTIATAAFGVLGGLAGSFFAVRAADKGVEQVARKVARERGEQPGTQQE